MPTSLQVVEIAERTDTGRVRDHNEDRSLASSRIAAVADGMGGALAGEVASQIAVDSLGGLSEPTSPDALRSAVERANRQIRRMAADDPAKAGMGTTMTVASFTADHLDVVHVGDSRAYLWRGGILRQLTDDHSVVAELVRRGSISAEEAERHPHRNVITRALGAEADVQVDAVAEPLHDADVILLCSDGLHSEISDEQIAAVLDSISGLSDAADGLVAAANAAGGSDNVTVVLARIGRVEAEDAAAMADPGPSATQEFPTLTPAAVSDSDTVEGDTAQAVSPTVIGGLASRQRERERVEAGPAAAPRVLEAAGRRRRRATPVVLGTLVALALAAGGIAWAQSRAFSLHEGAGGTIWVSQGVALGPLDTRSNWQDTGIAADSVAAADRALLDDIDGQGRTVLDGVRLIWSAQRQAPQLDVFTPVPGATAPRTPATPANEGSG
jgi:PPM family protein phosphatase